MKHQPAQKRGKVVTVMINNPPINEITDAMDIELSENFVDLDRDPDVKVMGLTASGRGLLRRQQPRHLVEHGRQREWVAVVRRSRRILMSVLVCDVPRRLADQARRLAR